MKLADFIENFWIHLQLLKIEIFQNTFSIIFLIYLFLIWGVVIIIKLLRKESPTKQFSSYTECSSWTTTTETVNIVKKAWLSSELIIRKCKNNSKIWRERALNISPKILHFNLKINFYRQKNKKKHPPLGSAGGLLSYFQEGVKSVPHWAQMKGVRRGSGGALGTRMRSTHFSKPDSRYFV